ncbi:hypothetical protein MMC28_007745 [Mycoblastus sanguinarius]|nr:hypothetical protein [Mycoblastus sanguinarius]
MPRTSLLPTPAASTEIHGKDGSPPSATEKERPFNLPPPAIESHRNHGASNPSRQPQLATSPKFTLPPPPTRSRTIIQMKPKLQQSDELVKPISQSGPKNTSKKAITGSHTFNGAGKKQPSSTSVAGKKIARKTAHSVIERRRRSKMNEEFGTLKAMIPACTDQEMHKLAILQASIDYLRYLENCISDLKAANNSLSAPIVQPQAPPSRFTISLDDGDEVDEDDEDITMDSESCVASPSCPDAQTKNYAYTSPESISISPELDPQPRYQSSSSHASSVSTLPSPAFGPQRHNHHGSQSQFTMSASTSPTIVPSKEQDQEATAALLMLNKDRRNPKAGRGMSVKDLLSP